VVDFRVSRAGRESEAYIGLAVVRSRRVDSNGFAPTSTRSGCMVCPVRWLGSDVAERAVWLPYQRNSEI
jgi:hypothetical protein